MRHINWLDTAKKWTAVLPLHPLIVHQAQISLVYQCRGLQAVPRALASHAPAGQSVEFPIDDGRQLLKGTFVSVAPGTERRWPFHHHRLAPIRLECHTYWGILTIFKKQLPGTIPLQNRKGAKVGAMFTMRRYRTAFRRTSSEPTCRSLLYRWFVYPRRDGRKIPSKQ